MDVDKSIWKGYFIPSSPDSLFRDDLFDKTCENIRNRNKVVIIRALIVPSAQTLAIYGATHLDYP